MSTKEQIDRALGWVNECQDLAANVGNACFDGPMTSLRGLAAAFIARAAQSLYSAGLLAREGFIGDAMSCGRTVVEMAIDFAYIARDAETRIARFMAYTDVHEFKLATNVAKHGGEVPAPVLAELAKRHQEFKDNNPGTRANWAGRPLNERADEADRSTLYELSYCDQCAATHSGPKTLEYTMVDDEDGERRVRFGRMTPDAHPIMCAYTAMLVLIGDVVEHCELDPELGVRSNQLSDHVRSMD